MIQSVVANMTVKAEKISELLGELLLDHSAIYLWNEPDSNFISTAGNHAYKDLDDAGRQIQAKLLKQYQQYFAVLSILLRDHPRDTIIEMEEADKVVIQTIEQQHTWSESIKDALETARRSLNIQVRLLNRLYDSNDGEIIYVPDTNALIFNPAIESWQFCDSPKFTLILLTTVVSELDSLKMNHRIESVREKAEKLIRKFKEYRRRGSLTEGVTVVRDKIGLQAKAIEVDMSKTLPWLDGQNNDDRILAGVLEVMREHPRSAVIAVSRDLNFQNKAEFASIPFTEPPAL